MDGAASHDELMDPLGPSSAPSRWRRKRVLIPGGLVLTLLFLLGFAWVSRETLADNFIQQELDSYGLPATYDSIQVGPQTQILTNVVVGDPKAPDLTAKRIEVAVRYTFGLPSLGRITIVEPRLFGSYRKGVLSFGALDKVIFRKTGQPPALPDFDLAIRDGRGLLDTDYGPVGFKAEGAGLLKNGFKGIFAAVAPQMMVQGCSTGRATLYGKVTTAAGKPHFSGPVRIAALACPSQGLALSGLGASLEAGTDAALANPSGEARFDSGALRYGVNRAATLAGTVRLGMKGDALTARYTLAARGVDTPQALAAVLTADGVVRARGGMSRVEIEGDIEGNGLRPGTQLAAALDGLSRVGAGTMFAPIARQIATALRRESRGSELEADVRVRKSGQDLTVLVPRAEMRGGSGERVLALSRVEVVRSGEGPPRLAGNLVSGGGDLPKLSGRMERAPNGDAVFRLTMAPYVAGQSRLTVPELTIAQGAGGALGFAGEVEASGALPGGMAEKLRLPINGRWSPGGELSLWRACTEIGFDRLELANLKLEKRRLTVCPPRGGAIVQGGAAGLRIAAGASSLDLSGKLGETPIRLSSGAVGFAWPGVARVEKLAVALGPSETASHFVLSGLDARIGDTIAGHFSGADVKLAAVPLDIGEAGGNWDFTDGRLTLADASFALTDRADPDRFERLVARDARLTLADNIILAHAEMRHPASDRVVAVADVRHDLGTGAGRSDLKVAGLQFDDRLQPDQLSHLALGVIANAKGTITGDGRFDWNASGVTSSGTFATDGLDFAAVFGPVKGVSGKVKFTDLINLTTAPDQRIHVASVNPGVEVLGGDVDFEMKNSRLLAVKGGHWPFMGGTLWLREFNFNFGVSEERRYIFEIEGLQAAQFVQQMDLENIAANGLFDGTVPIVFDKNGNGRIEEGVLISRPPGGNLSYVGELTYKDLSPIANFAFNALRSLDYTQMRVIMEGPLTGDIVTRVRFDGVSQGEGTKNNFITRQLANLPLQFRINIKAQFYQLMTSMKSLYDPSAVRDPRELGLLSDDGKRLLRPEVKGEDVQPKIEPDDLIPHEKPIQQ